MQNEKSLEQSPFGHHTPPPSAGPACGLHMSFPRWPNPAISHTKRHHQVALPTALNFPFWCHSGRPGGAGIGVTTRPHSAHCRRTPPPTAAAGSSLFIQWRSVDAHARRHRSVLCSFSSPPSLIPLLFLPRLLSIPFSQFLSDGRLTIPVFYCATHCRLPPRDCARTSPRTYVHAHL